MKRIALALLALAAVSFFLGFGHAAFAQNTIDFNVDTTTGAGQLVTTVTWSTNPPAPNGCDATGAPEWQGAKAGEGLQELTLTQSVTLNIQCTWPGDSIATLTWTNPTENEDDSPYTDPKATVIRWIFEGEPRGLPGVGLPDVLNPPPAGVQSVQLDPTFTMHTITGLSSGGSYSFTALACNLLDTCSQPSNVAQKSFTGLVSVTESVGITVNPRPGAITDLQAT